MGRNRQFVRTCVALFVAIGAALATPTLASAATVGVTGTTFHLPGQARGRGQLRAHELRLHGMPPGSFRVTAASLLIGTGCTEQPRSLIAQWILGAAA
jgi:hypothetical protein